MKLFEKKQRDHKVSKDRRRTSGFNDDKKQIEKKKDNINKQKTKFVSYTFMSFRQTD